jgi:hypothetical protein
MSARNDFMMTAIAIVVASVGALSAVLSSTTIVRSSLCSRPSLGAPLRPKSSSLPNRVLAALSKLFPHPLRPVGRARDLFFPSAARYFDGRH